MGRNIQKIKVHNAYDINDAQRKRIPESEIRSIETDAIVDTGATFVCLGKKDIEKLHSPKFTGSFLRTGRAWISCLSTTRTSRTQKDYF